MKAIIDLGTNTFHLLIAEAKGNELVEHYKLQIPVKLGEDMSAGKITDKAMCRGFEALGIFRKQLDAFGIEDVHAYATSAIRTSENGKDFVSEVLNRYQIRIETLSGDDEATYIYNGVRHAIDLPEQAVLVMDIGGGSVEFIIGSGDMIRWKQSFEIGAARLIEQFHRHDPILPEELKALEHHLQEQFKPLGAMLAKHPVNTLIGSAGSFETLADVVREDLGGRQKPIGKHAFEISPSDLARFYNLMIHSSAAQRSALKGMTDFRVEMIVVSAVLMKYVVDSFAISRVLVSSYALKEGLLFSSSFKAW